jgi:hypothetical protein
MLSKSLRVMCGAVVLALVPLTTAAAQGQPAKPMEQGDEGHAIPWKALDAYHTVMAASWHPAKDKNDLAPFRAKAGALVSAARAVGAEPVPAVCGGASRNADVQALVRVSEEAARLAGVAGTPDAQVKDALKAAHDRFHTLEEACMAGQKGH